MRIAAAIGLVLVLAAPAGAQAPALMYDFEWQSVASSTRDNIPFDPVVFTGTLNGSGTLALQVLPAGSPELGPLAGDPAGAYFFQFSGAGGAGFGVGTLAGVIPPEMGTGSIGFPVAGGVPGLGETPPTFFGGLLALSGDPAQPAGLSLSYAEGDRSNTFCPPCWSVEFSGTGLLQTAGPEGPPVEAPEPLAGAVVVGLGLLVAARRR